MSGQNDGLMLVLGATGKTGRRVVERLRAGGAQVRAASRGAERPFDWGDRQGWGAVLEGVTTLYITYQPDLALPQAQDDIATLLAMAAEGETVRRVVLLSGRSEPGAQACERLVQASGFEWTVVRASWFAQNFDEGMLLEAVRSGVLALPAGEVSEPFVDVEDIAEIVVEAMLSDRHVNQLYEVTGPRLWRFDEVARLLTQATGRPVRYVPCTPAQMEAGLCASGVPAPMAAALTHLFAMVLDGRNAYTCDGVERALGRPAGSLEDYVRRAAARGVWS